MSQDEQLEQLINQTLDAALATIQAHLEEIKQNKDIIKVENPNKRYTCAFDKVREWTIKNAEAALGQIK